MSCQSRRKMPFFKCIVFFNVWLLCTIGVICEQQKISDKRLCGNSECTEKLGIGKTLISYGSTVKNVLSFKNNEEVVIYSRPAGSNLNLIGVEINGKRGYVPKDLVKETKTLKKAEILVDTEVVKSEFSTDKVPSVEKPTPDPVKLPYEVIEGTKIPLDQESNDNIYNLDNTKNSATPTPDEKINENDKKGLFSSVKNFIDNIDSKYQELLESIPDNDVENENIVKKNSNEIDQNKFESNKVGRNILQVKDEKEETKPAKISTNNIENINKNSNINNVSISDENKIKNNDKEFVKDENKKDENLLELNENEQITVKINPEATEIVNITTENVNNKSEQPVGQNISESQLVDSKNLDDKTTQQKKDNLNFQSEQVIKKENSFNGAENNKVELKSEQKLNINTEDENISKKSEPLETDKNDKQSHSEVVELERKNSFEIDKSEKNDSMSETSEDKSTINKMNENIPQKITTEQTKKSDNHPTINIYENMFKHSETNLNNHVPPLVNKDDISSDSDKQSNINDNYLSPNIKIEKQKEPTLKETEFEPAKITTNNIDNLNENSNINNVQISDKNKIESNGKDIVKDVKNVTENLLELKENEQLIDKIQPVTEIMNVTSEKVNSKSEQEADQNIIMKSQLVDGKNIDNKSELQENDTIVLSERSDPNLNMKDNYLPQNNDNNSNYNEKQIDSILGTYSIFDHENETENNLATDEKFENYDSKSGNINSLYDTFKVSSEIKENDFEENLQKSNIFDLTDQEIKKKLNEENTNENIPDFKLSNVQTKTGESEYCLAYENSENCALERKKMLGDGITFQQNIIDFFLNVSNEVLATIIITSITTLFLLLGYMHINKSNRIRPLIAKINQLEKDLIFSEEENKLMKEKLLEVQNQVSDQVDNIPSDIVESIKQELEEALTAKASLEEQITNLEKELENSTEVGMELNRMLSDFLSSPNSDTLAANVEQLQRQLVEQQSTINTYTETLNVKETEIHEIRLELEISNSKLTDLQKENEKATANLIKIEEEKYDLSNKLQSEINALKNHIDQLTKSSTAQINKLTEELKMVQKNAAEFQRIADLKSKEYDVLVENTHKLKSLKNEDVNSLLDVVSCKAELDLLTKEKEMLIERCNQSDEIRNSFDKQFQVISNEMQNLQHRYDEADREKLEAQTKLEVLENYFKERESQLQKELAKHEAMFMEKQGETYSIAEKIKFMQEELQNYKAQNESLKQEIMEQEVQMKSQISLLEKRVHENWVNARQAERKLEEARQEAAQLRNRLTMRERTMHEDKYQNRIKSPNEANGELPISPTPASPPLLFGSRDLTTSPPLPGLPPHFLPPPFIPPPMPGGVPFMPLPSSMPPPLSSMFPSDRRPAPLGRMSSPPINSRYSPDSRAYSPYSRNSPSPTSDDDYPHSPPPMHRGYSPVNVREMKREYRRSPGISKNFRNHKGSMQSSGSGNSNESLEKISRKQSKV